ncbi:helix-turn-helix domain-containing protein [Streptomyces coacervatus]|uniref:Helix-turn-helix domain-containing protein n=1 Tax=Streptomyces coacervatus TaxID=647381 RepID=A0ABP7GX77_9ACTN|nr:helix-turn-helix domain-containing protein [Streptomyces coacervatus]MDF2265011.1 helix-turn-helix domain-containing protein [Streptomyces coacervatus]
MTNGPGPGRTFAVDVTAPGNPRHGFDVFRSGWEAQVGEAYPAPAFAPGSTGDFRISARAVKAHESVIADVHSESLIGTNEGVSPQRDDQVLMHVVRRHAWSFTRRRDGELTVAAGHFMLQRSGPPTFEVARHTSAKVLILPASALGPLTAERLITGSAASAEMRLLLAHVNLVGETVQDLTPAGAQAAQHALIELVKGVLRQQADGTEQRLGHALVRAAKDLADSRLTDPGLSPSVLARELSVSVRTLHRAFAAAEETVSGHIRRSRLERARLELLAPAGRPGISELAAHWQFADSSHFIRAFKSQYGLTPAEFARTSGGAEPGTG